MNEWANSLLYWFQLAAQLADLFADLLNELNGLKTFNPINEFNKQTISNGG